MRPNGCRRTASALVALSAAASPLVTAQLIVPSDADLGMWEYRGCYTDVGRTINAANTASDTMTIEKCLDFCEDADMAYAGLEYHNECYCGQKLATAAAKADDESQCSTACSGNSTEACGGPNRLTLFYNQYNTGPQPNVGIKDWPFLGCYTEGTARALPHGAGLDGSTLTGEKCTAACKAAGYVLAGTEYGGECYCGNDFSAGVKAALDGCDMKCNGNKTEVCGGSNRLNVYDYLGQYAESHSSTTSSATASQTSAPTTTADDVPDVTTTSSVSTTDGDKIVTSTTSAPNAVATGFPAGWTYQGCWQDGPNGRIMPTFQAPDDDELTLQSCAQLCNSKGYSISGTEYFAQCFCGNAIYNGGKDSGDESKCSTACKGDNTQMCGGAGYLSIYSNGTPKTYQPPAPQVSGLNDTWEYQGCYQDNINNQRTFPWTLNFPGTNTPELCLGKCAEFGYAAAGLEYGEECYCGDPSDIDRVGSTKLAESQCNIVCAGDGSAICGGGGTLSTYFWNGTEPLYKFNYPKGINAGSYSNLVGGVVTPLMTMQSITGKVTFLEKFGTGAANSTGAYELDLTELGNFDKAWRTMHVKTDIFCSAGVILPDKGGRQLTVGGWSLDSTYGVRLYWPDGSDGVDGTRDWEEDVQRLKLQQGRWYPSAMIMTNGSILVIGGEIGSNDKPVPTLEILPSTGTAPLYMDWLERTDPNNLYPFVCVLPGGGIFVQYWNEARILDEKTFDTIKTLPDAPGSVADPLGGRTYPLEGAAVLLPQRAPYSDDLGVLICGGSTTGMQALDNCVTIYPDAAEPEWTLERMPSKRVMSCMSPLPDGTYLIANGAKQGVAGFGLADNPNLNAVLYDPSLPVGQRMHVMANTSVARLYHSEAITLLDGRVLITGSDPQDGKHPEEIRVEVFTPPYLLQTAKPRPSFTITDKDWDYGHVASFTLGSAPAGTIEVSLLGAVSSTHGNSMGARTLFPAVTCTGRACKVTAPPSVYIAPPGWYQMFVLQDGIPAVGTYVRIGGDPAGLGNWPQGDKFSRPGV